MAITAETRNDIIELVVTAYNAAPGTTLLNELVAIVNGGGTLADVAANLTTRTEWTSKYPSFQTAEEFAAEWLSNLVPEASAAALTEGTAVVVGLVNGGTSFGDIIVQAQTFLSGLAETDASFGSSAANFNNKVEVATHHTVTLEESAQSSSAVQSVTSNDATVESAKTALGGGASAGGSTFTATTGTDAIVGTNGNDVINAASGTFNAGDTFNGGDGTDTLNVTWSGTGPAQSATTLSNVEILNLTASPNPASLALTGVTGLTQINNVNSANGASVTVSGVGAPVSSTINGQSTTTISYTTAVTGTTATSDAATLTLEGVTAGSSYTATGIDQLTINSTKAENTLGTLGVSTAATVTIGGDQKLTLGTVGGSKLTTLDASGFTGSELTVTAGAGAGGTSKAGVTITAPTAEGTTATITAGGNKDTITLGAGTNTVDAGAGDDTITSAAGTNTIIPGAGNDTITLTTGKDTIRYADTGSSNADTINGFDSDTVFAFNLGKAAVAGTSAASAGTFGTVQTGATSPSFSNVDGTGTGTAIAFATVAPNSTATSNPVSGSSNVLALNGQFTNGTAQGVIDTLGTTATTGIATTSSSKFLIVTYSVGNIAQIWSYGGDSSTGSTDIDASELSLVATLNGVAQNSLTAANFATYLTVDATSSTAAATGQTIALSGTLNTAQSSANAAGQFLTAANDTINVGVGTLPTAAATTTSGLTIIDDSSSDADVLNGTVLGDWAAGSVISGIETINLNMLVNGTTFSAAAKTPGTTTFGLTGTSTFTVTALPANAAITLGSGYTGTATVSLASDAGTADKLTVNLAGSSATSATEGANLDIAQVADDIETVTLNVNSSSSLRMNGVELFGAANDAGNINVSGTGNLTIHGTAAALDTLVLNASGVTYTGALTLAPSTNANMDFSDTASTVTGIDVIDLKNIAAFGSTITFDANNGTGVTPTISYAPTSAGSIGALDINIEGSGLSDAVNISLGSNSGNVTSINGADGVETLSISISGTSSRTIGAVTLTDGVGTQSITVSAAGNVVANTFTADSVNTSGVTGTVTNLTLANTAGATFTGGSGATTVTGSAAADVINTGAGGDTIDGAAGDDVINAGAGADTITGGNGIDTITTGTGADTVKFASGVSANRNIITDFTAGTGGDIINFNSGVATLTGTDNFANATSVQTVSATGNATANAAAEVVKITAATIADTTSANSLNGTNLLAALAGTLTGAIAGQNDILVAIGVTGGGTAIYHASSADNAIIATEILLIGVLPNTAVSGLTNVNFANAA